MAILKIARMGHPILMQPAQHVSNPTAPEVHALINDMIETMFDAPGIGLAAPQVHVPVRIVIFHVPKDQSEDTEKGMPLTTLINPEIRPLCDEMEDGIEGCLSLPDMVGIVPRYKRICYKATLPDGGIIEEEAEGYHARVVQHECDHLDGILYPMRMTDISKLGYSDEMAKVKMAGGGGGE